MINLLPPKDKKIIRQLYLRRLIIVSLAVLFFIVVVANILLLPTLFISSVKNKAIAENLEVTKNSVAAKGIEDYLITVKDVSKKITLLNKPSEGFITVQNFLRKVVFHSRGKVLINNISYEEEGISLRGKSLTRKRFLEFIKSLEEDPFFVSVQSPLSNIIADEDINFMVTLEINPEKSDVWGK